MELDVFILIFPSLVCTYNGRVICLMPTHNPGSHRLCTQARNSGPTDLWWLRFLPLSVGETGIGIKALKRWNDDEKCGLLKPEGLSLTHLLS